MKKLLMTVLAAFGLLAGRAAYAQDMGFENPDNDNKGLPAGLSAKGSGFDFKLDAGVKHSGKYALMIASKPEGADNSYGMVSYTIPAKFNAEQLRLKGWIKSEHITGTGRAALWLRIDGDKGILAMDNMMIDPVAEDMEWTQFSVIVPYSPNAQKIVFGGMLTGKGKVWFDDLELVPVNKETATSSQGPSSGVGSIPFSTDNLKNLYLLGKVWGVLKYFHPKVAQGKQDWDAELFTELKKVQQAPAAFDAEMQRWIGTLGDLPACATCDKAQTDTLLKQNSWIDQRDLSPELIGQLKAVITAHHTGSNKYVALLPGTQNPDFRGEAAYADVDQPDAGFRMLTLFRFWNMVNYYYPYKHLIGTDWDITLVRMIPDFLRAQTKLDYKLAVWRMVSNIHDTHANLYNHSVDEDLSKFLGGNRQLPLRIAYVDGQWTVTDVYDRVPAYTIKKGDVITHIGDMPIAQRVTKLKPYACASNDAAAFRNIAGDLFWTNADTLKLQLLRNGQALSVAVPTLLPNDIRKQITAYQAGQQQLPAYKLLNPKVGYVTFDRIKSSFFDEMFKAFASTKGIVMDLRNYPAEFVVFSLNAYLRDKPEAFVKFTHPVVDRPGMLTLTEEIKAGNDNKKSYKGKIVVLVNEQTQSQAEYTAMALSAGGRAVVMGSQTAGADGNISKITFPGGLSTFFSGLGVLYPDGKETQRIGIVPDIEVKPTIKGIAQGRDEVLEKATAWISSN